MVTQDRVQLENRLTKVEDGQIALHADVTKILTNHLPHIDMKLKWLIGIVLALAAIHDFNVVTLIRGLL
jgi:hypothetical protein